MNQLIKENRHKLDKTYLSYNPCTLPFLKEYPELIDWYALCKTCDSIDFLLQNYDKINWTLLIDRITHDRCGLASWECWLSNQLENLTPNIDLGYSTNRLGIWHICPYTAEKVNRICNTDEPLTWGFG